MAEVTDNRMGCESCEDQQKVFDGIKDVKYISFGYDPNNKSFDIFLRQKEMEWNDGVGIQLNKLSKADKDAMRKALDESE